MKCKVVKFGGTSMSTGETIKQVAQIIKSDEERRYVVVSAPGKRNKDDKKVTDLLYACYHEIDLQNECPSFQLIRERFLGIAEELNVDIRHINDCLNETEEKMKKYRSSDYCASRGEYLSALLLSQYLGYPFLDAAEIIKFSSSGEFESEYTNDISKQVLSTYKTAVIPGFYGSSPEGMIHTFSRGGSDVTGAIIARAVGAAVYENWTDVNGFMSADPRIVSRPKPINQLSFRELRELSYMGANVLHPESIFPLKVNGIPINIRNTFQPNHQGTMILPKIENQDDRIVTGIAGKKNFCILHIEKSMMNSELGFARRVLTILEYYEVSFEHMPSGIDTLTLVISENEIRGKAEAIIDKIKKTVKPDVITLHEGIALIATVGHNMAFKIGTSARLFKALADAKINIRMIDQGSSELNIIVAVDNDEYENAIKAIYGEFFF